MQWNRLKSALPGWMVAAGFVVFANTSVADPGRMAGGAVVPVAAAPVAAPLDKAIDLQAPLSRRDAALYAWIFALQEEGRFADADLALARLGDDLLLGPVLYQRYMHPTAYRSSFEELAGWLEHYAAHPGAVRVHRLARKRRPAGADAPLEPLRGYLRGGGQELQELTWFAYDLPAGRAADQTTSVRRWLDALDHAADRGWYERAGGIFADDPALPFAAPIEREIGRWSVARAALMAGEARVALELMQATLAATSETVEEMHWTAGLAAWKLGRIEAAAGHFEALALAPDIHDVERARAAFWAARARVALAEPGGVRHFLEMAAAHPERLYGQLARAALGRSSGHDWAMTPPEPEVLRALLAAPGVRRAVALNQVGRSDLAERELRKLAAGAGPDQVRGLVGIAEALDLPSAQMRLGLRLSLQLERFHHAAMFPLPTWEPLEGFVVDRALILAVARAESAFDPAAESHVGALGLMQVMPATAEAVAGMTTLDYGEDALLDPESALSFGQAYLEHLLGRASFGQSLIHVIAGYNAGPGRVAGWQTELSAADDPLLFIESIPFQETRTYVKKVLVNLWTYRERLGQTPTSRDALAANTWPRYAAQDEIVTADARNR